MGFRRPKVISLFTGAGGLDYGLEAAGFQTIVAVEQDSDCADTLTASRGWPVLNMAISSVTIQMLLDAASARTGEVDLVIGGPPCQPFSRAASWARGQPLGLQDRRAQTIVELLNVVEGVLPKALIIENVEGFGRGKNLGAVGLIQRRLRQINSRCGTNYSIHATILDAADYGVPQHRRRLFLVASRKGASFDFPAPTHGTDSGLDLLPYLTAWDALGDIGPKHPENLSLKGRWADLLPSIPEGHNYLWHTDRQGGLPIFGWRTRYWSFLLKLAKNKPSWTIPATPSQNSGPFHWDNRLLSTRELMRLQTFPDDVTICGDRASRQRQLGNAVPSLMAEVLGREVRLQLLDKKSRFRIPPKLSFPAANSTPAPTAPSPVSQKYISLVGPHDPHPGTGLGPGAIARHDGPDLVQPELDRRSAA